MNWLNLTEKEEEILWKAIEEPSILEVIKNQKSLERIRSVRELLLKNFPEIKNLPDRYGLDDKSRAPLLPPPSANFFVAQALIYLLREKRPNWKIPK